MEKKKLVLEDFITRMTNEEFNEYAQRCLLNESEDMYTSDTTEPEFVDASDEEVLEALGGITLEEFDKRMREAADEYFNRSNR